MLALRENQIVDVLDDFLHYTTDTEPGSSGSPVFNDSWEVIALHHCGVPATDKKATSLRLMGRSGTSSMGEDQKKWAANEGARVSRIIPSMKDGVLASTPEMRALLDEALSTPSKIFTTSLETSAMSNQPNINPLQNSNAPVIQNGTATWTIPLNISISLGGVGAIGNASDQQPAKQAALSIIPAPPSLHSNLRDAILDGAQKEFSRFNEVLNVRHGYVFENGWITDKPAIVVTVRDKQKSAGIPASFMGIPVELENPTSEDLFRDSLGDKMFKTLLTESTTPLSADEIIYTPPPGAKLEKLVNNK